MSSLQAANDAEFIDTAEGIASLVDLIARQDTMIEDRQPPLYIGLEGERPQPGWEDPSI